MQTTSISIPHTWDSGTHPAEKITYARNAMGKVISETQQTGNMTVASGKTYDQLRRIASETDRAGLVTQTSYADNGLTQTVTTPAGATLVTKLHSDGSLLEESGTGQQARYYSYDMTPDGVMTTVRINSPDGPVVRQTVVDALERPIIERTPGGNGTMLEEKISYDAKGHVFRRQRTGKPDLLYEYDAMGDLVKLSWDSSNFNKVIKYNRQYVHGSSSGSSLLADAFVRYSNNIGQPDAQSWMNGYTFTQTTETKLNYADGYDASWMTIKQVSSSDRLLEDISVSISQYGRQELACTVNNGIFSTECRHMGHIGNAGYKTTVLDYNLVETDPAGVSTHYQYTWNQTGFSIALTDARNNTTTHQYDRAGRLLSTTDATGTIIEQYLYHTSSGLISQMTDAEGNTVHYVYDNRERKTSQYGTAVYPVAYEYDNADRLVKLHTWRDGTLSITTDPAGKPGADTTTWTYDSATGLLLEKRYDDDTAETYTYTALGQLKSKTLPDGKKVTHYYERGYSEPTQTEYRRTADSPVETYISRRFSVWGMPWSFKSNIKPDPEFDDIYNSYTYNQYGSLIHESHQNRNYDAIHELNYSYDDQGRYTGYRLSSFDGVLQNVEMAYDNLDRIDSVTLNGNQIFTYGYDPVTGRQQSITYPNGMVKTSALEEKRDYVKRIDYRQPGIGDSLFTQQLEWSDAGRLSSETRRLSQTGNRTNTYAYNTRGELTGANLGGYGARNWNYDNIGNRTNCSLETGEENTVYQTNGLNQYTSINGGSSSITPEYDLNGNQTITEREGGCWRIEYNAMGRSSAFYADNGAEPWECAYDALNRRVAFYETKTDTPKKIRGEYFIYLGTQIIGIADLDNGYGGTRIRETYLWDPTQPKATRPLAMTALNSNLGTEMTTHESRLTGLQVTQSSSTSSSAQAPPSIDVEAVATWYYLHDHNKNVVALMQADSSQINAWYEYDPYGSILNPDSGPDAWNPFCFASEYHNSTTGLIDYLYRSYNPKDGRWTQRDPIAERGGINLYGFIWNDPVNLFDWLGEEPEPISKPFLTDVTDLRVDVERIPNKPGVGNCHISTPEGGKYVYVNRPDGMPEFIDKDGNKLPKKYEKMLANKQSRLAKAFKKAADHVNSEGGISTKYGGGKVLGAIGIIFALKQAEGACEKYMKAFKVGDIGTMDKTYNEFILNFKEFSHTFTATRAFVWEATGEYHEEMKEAAIKNKNN